MESITLKRYSKLKNSLRKCQIDAINSATKYLKNPPGNKSCLLSLPTGAGKTGVISTICLLSKKDKILILSHRSAVRDQLIKEIGGGFFKSVLKEINFNYSPSIELKDRFDEVGIYVSTFQKLCDISNKQMIKMKKEFSFIIIDEGHAEPAPQWSKIVRGFSGHKIIITATPYRNDLFQFDINSSSGYIYTFKQAA